MCMRGVQDADRNVGLAGHTYVNIQCTESVSDMTYLAQIGRERHYFTVVSLFQPC